jgi:hypothetical protein
MFFESFNFLFVRNIKGYLRVENEFIKVSVLFQI